MNKRIRINTSVIVLENNNVKVYRAGSQISATLVNDENATKTFYHACKEEIKYYLNK